MLYSQWSSCQKGLSYFSTLGKICMIILSSVVLGVLCKSRLKKYNNAIMQQWSITKTYLVLGCLIATWCLITPFILINDFRIDHNLDEFIRTTRETPKNTIPAFIKVDSKLWTLDNLSKTELRELDWLEKGNKLIENNLFYLSQSEGRATGIDSNITLISGLLDLGRGDLKESFRRSFQHYIDRFSNFLKYKFPKIIFIKEEHLKYYQPIIDEVGYPVHVITVSLDEIYNFPYYNQIQKIRTNPKWYKQAGWLEESPQASMNLYNPMVMSKILWTKRAAQLNPFNTDSFLWVDGNFLNF